MSNLNEIKRAEEALKPPKTVPFYKCARFWLMVAFVLAGIVDHYAPFIPGFIPEALIWILAGAFGLASPQPRYLAERFGDFPARTRGSARIAPLVILALLSGLLLFQCRPLSQREADWTMGLVSASCALLRQLLDPNVLGISERAATLVALGCEAGTLQAAHIVPYFVEPEFGWNEEEVAQLERQSAIILPCRDFDAACADPPLEARDLCRSLLASCHAGTGALIYTTP